MIQSLTVKNFLSFKDEVTFSFEATKDKAMEDYHVVEIVPGVKLLKLGVIYGANASGKSNLLEAFEFIKDIWSITTDSKDEKIGVEPFLLDLKSKVEPSYFNLIFYANGKKYDYSLTVNNEVIVNEKLNYYPSVQPKLIFERTNKKISEIEYGHGVKLSATEKKEISVKCLTNMSVFSAYKKVNVEVSEIEDAIDWGRDQFMGPIEPDNHASLSHYVENMISKDEDMKEDILTYLKEADFNISNIHTSIIKEKIPDFILTNILDDSNFPQKEKDRIRKEKTFEMPKTEFEHAIYDDEGNVNHFVLPKRSQSEGTLRTFELSGPILEAIKKNAFLAIDEIESKLHPRLIEYIIESFLKKSNQAQLLVSAHYDGLLDEDDLLRKDNIWFTEKDKSGSTNLYSLSNFKALNRISSLLKAYKYGNFGAIPNIN